MPGLHKDIKEKFVEKFFEFSMNQDYMSFEGPVTLEFLKDVSDYFLIHNKVVFHLSNLTYDDFEKLAICCRFFYREHQDSIVRNFVISWFEQEISFNLSPSFQ